VRYLPGYGNNGPRLRLPRATRWLLRRPLCRAPIGLVLLGARADRAPEDLCADEAIWPQVLTPVNGALALDTDVVAPPVGRVRGDRTRGRGATDLPCAVANGTCIPVSSVGTASSHNSFHIPEVLVPPVWFTTFSLFAVSQLTTLAQLSLTPLASP
jgi:hypothetical protein